MYLPQFLKMTLEILEKKGHRRYNIFQCFWKINYKVEIFLHAPTFNYNKVMQVLDLAKVTEPFLVDSREERAF